MAAPKLSEAYIKNSTKVVLSFDQPLDDTVAVPDTCFSINYGRIPVTSIEYYGTAQMVLNLSQTILPKDKLQVNYQPPDDVSQALRGALGDNPTATQMRRNAVRAFFKVPVMNQLAVNESSWAANSNLGGGARFIPDPDDPDFDGGINIPGFDLCGDGSIIVGNPNNIINGGDAGNGDGGDAGGDGGDVNPPEPIAPGNEGAVAPMASASQVQNLPYPIATRPNPRAATPDDFVMAYGLREAIQISNIDDADATQPNTDKIWMAIEDACALIDNYINGATRAGKILISSSRRRTALIIARYYLDTVRRREDVKSDYEQAITELDKARSLRDIDRPSLPWWADPCNPNRNGGVRSHRIPQVYNGVSGKGLSGHWSDSGYSEVDDWRYDRNNAEGNNDQGNHAGRRYLGGDRTLDQPIDTGGNNDGGDTP